MAKGKYGLGERTTELSVRSYLDSQQRGEMQWSEGGGRARLAAGKGCNAVKVAVRDATVESANGARWQAK